MATKIAKILEGLDIDPKEDKQNVRSFLIDQVKDKRADTYAALLVNFAIT